MTSLDKPTQGDIHIKSEDLCSRCAFGVEQCGENCRTCPMAEVKVVGNTRGPTCLCLEIASFTPCPYFQEATNEGK